MTARRSVLYSPRAAERPGGGGGRQTEGRDVQVKRHGWFGVLAGAAVRSSWGLAFAAVVCGSAALAAPQPDPVPRRWELRLEPGALHLDPVRWTDDEGRERFGTYYWMTYTVTNNTDRDRVLAPVFQLHTDDGVTRRSGRGVPYQVTEALLARIGDELLEDELSMQQRPLLRGEAHARDGLVIWPADDLSVDEVVVFAAGFSGETETVELPDTGERVTLRKTLMLRHAIRGELDPTDPEPLRRTMTRWILR